MSNVSELDRYLSLEHIDKESQFSSRDSLFITSVAASKIKITCFYFPFRARCQEDICVTNTGISGESFS